MTTLVASAVYYGNEVLLDTVLAGAGSKKAPQQSCIPPGVFSYADSKRANRRWQVYQVVQLFSSHLVDGQHELL